MTPPAPPSTDLALAERVTELEVRAAYQDHVIAQLDEVVRQFAAQVERLERRVGELQQTPDTEAVGAADEPPPHY